jgi:hypothetical protein
VRESGEPGGSARFPYASIVQMRHASFDPTRFGSGRHRCDLRLANGQPMPGR